MPKIPLTDLTLKNLKPPPKGQVSYWDTSLKGFGIRLSPGGAKTFVLVYGKNRMRTTIGRYPVISLSEARTTAKRILAERTLGKYRPRSIAFEDALKDFLAEKEQTTRKSTLRSYEQRLTRHFLPLFRQEKLEALTTVDVNRRLERLRKTPSEQAHALVALKTFFRWAVQKGYLSAVPVTASARPSPSRDRVLSKDELKRIYNAAIDDTNPFHDIVRLLILTGQRRSETARLKAEYISQDTRTITLPAELTKNGREHRFPYGDLTAALLSKLPQEGYLFPASRSHVRGKKTSTFNGWSKAKADFDALCGVSDWTLHDLRRTFSTNMAALGVPIHVTEKLLNHVSGSISGVAAIYNRHSYLPEMREAVAKWEACLSALTKEE